MISEAASAIAELHVDAKIPPFYNETANSFSDLCIAVLWPLENCQNEWEPKKTTHLPTCFKPISQLVSVPAAFPAKIPAFW